MNLIELNQMEEDWLRKATLSEKSIITAKGNPGYSNSLWAV